MKFVQPLLIATSALALFVSACSTPADLQQPLTAQFGSADKDDGVDVATVSSGQIYSLSSQRGNPSGAASDLDFYVKALLRRYDASGKLIWTRTVDDYACENANDLCGDSIVRSLQADLQGNTYTTILRRGISGDCVDFQSSFVKKYDATGRQVAEVALGTTGAYFEAAFNGSVATAVDGSGHIYAVLEKVDDLEKACHEEEKRTNAIVKHAPGGTLLWERTSTVGVPYGVTVSPGGSVYVTGSKGIARYTGSGSLTWTRLVGRADQAIISGSNLYTRYGNTLRKYDGNGKLLWTKAQAGLSGINTQDMTGDTAGNLYLSGKYNVTSSNRDAFTRKLNASGSVLWTKTFGTTAFDDAKGIATINGSEIYVTGLTKGSLAHTNIGGDDGYIRKLNSSGNTLWTR